MALKSFTFLLALPLVTGCGSTTPAWDQKLGDSVREARAQQQVDPAAATRQQQQGVDGKAAVGALKTYAESYGYAVREPRPATLAAPPSMAVGR